MIFADALAKKLPSKFIPKWKFDSDLIKLGKKCQKKNGDSPYTKCSVNIVADKILCAAKFRCPFNGCQQ